MPGPRLLAIDIGTTGVRAAILDPAGTLLADKAVSCMYDAPEPGWAEIAADQWWQSLKTALDDLATRTTLTDIAAIAVVGQAPTAVLVDEKEPRSLRRSFKLDTRATNEARELGVHTYYLGPKLLWLSRRGATAKARWILQSHAYIAHRLTGEAATDPSTGALCTPLFDLSARAWIPAACAAVGIRADQLPPIRAAHDVIGRVTAEAAAALGLRAGTPVVSGGGDFAAATLGAGVLDEGEACLMLGTAGNLLVPRRTPGTDPRLINAHHVGPDRWLSLGGTLSGGAQEWLRFAMTRSVSTESTAVRNALPTFELLDEEAAQVAAGSEGLLFLPYLQGERTPIWDADARGAYVGLGTHHGRGHLWRALLEGIALGFADCQDVLAEDGVQLRNVVAANGGGKSALFRQILCDALGVPLSYMPESGGTVAGAAILAGLGVGSLSAEALLADKTRRRRGASVSHDPDPKAHRLYRELLGLRRESYAGLKPVFAALARRR